MNKFNCPVCSKELIRLKPFAKGVYEFWCDDCDIDVTVRKNDEVEPDVETVYLTDITGYIGEWLDAEFDDTVPHEVVNLLTKAYEISAKELERK